MGYWKDDRYYYSIRELQNTAINYKELLNGNLSQRDYSLCDTGGKRVGENEWLSNKIDFDRALAAIGKGCWSGTHFGENPVDLEWGTYRFFSRKQLVVIADILGYDKWDLEKFGFYEVEKLRIFAYGAMARFLNYGV